MSQEVIKCDLSLETRSMPDLKLAIPHCETVRDFGSRELFTDILESEEEHIDWLQTQLRLIEQMGIAEFRPACRPSRTRRIVLGSSTQTTFRVDIMKTIISGVAAAALLASPAFFALPAWAQSANPNPDPSCHMCEGTYIPAEEIQAYLDKAVKEHKVDQQDRDIDIGKVNIALGVEHRGKLDKPAPHAVAEHDLVSEVYHVIAGTATLELGPNLVNKKRRPADQETVRLYNGPGNDADDIKGGISYQFKAGRCRGHPRRHRPSLLAYR